MNLLRQISICVIAVTLLTGGVVFAETEVHGEVFGVWTVEGQPYLVTDYLSVTENDSLVIDAGVNVLFQGNYNFVVYGYLAANGTEQDSIHFQAGRENNDAWGGIRFLDNATNCELQYCVISGGRTTAGGYFEQGAAGGNVFIRGDNVLVAHCSIVNGGAVGMGGGIMFWRSNARMEDCFVGGNESAFMGGGCAMYNLSAPTISDCEFSSNESTNGGGGILVSMNSNPTISTSIISENIVAGRNGAGGGMFVRDTSGADVSDCLFERNAVNGEGADGGALAIRFASSPMFTNCTFNANESKDSGGGCYVRGPATRPVFDKCTWTNNTITDGDRSGGAIYIREQSHVEIKHNQFFNNVTDYGGAITVKEPPRCSIHHNLFKANGARIGGAAIAVTNDLGEQALSVSNCTFVGQFHSGLNPVPLTAFARGESAINLTSCIIWDDGILFLEESNVSVSYSNIRGGFEGEENSEEDPMFYTADTEWSSLHGLSPCIDSGYPELAEDPDETVNDRGWLYFPQNAWDGIQNDTLSAAMTTIDRRTVQLQFRNDTEAPLFLCPMDLHMEGIRDATRDLSFLIGDYELNGVAWVNDCFYVCGGNSGRSPNKIYQLNGRFDLINNFDQPNDPGDLGFMDMTSDGGEVLFAGANGAVVEFTVDGEFGEAIDINYENAPELDFVKSIAFDDENAHFFNDFYLAGEENFIVMTDGDLWERARIDVGSEVLAMDVKRNSRGLYIITADGEDYVLSLLMPDEGTVYPLYKLRVPEGYEIGGIEVTQDWETGQGTLIVMFKGDGHDEDFGDRLVVEELYTSWMVIIPEERVLLPGEETSWEITIAGDQMPAGDYESLFYLMANGRGDGGEVYTTLELTQSSVEDNTALLPQTPTITALYPNPFNSITRFEYVLPGQMDIKLSVIDTRGRTLMNLGRETQMAGKHFGVVDASALPSGNYYLRLEAGEFTSTQKMVLVK